MDWNEHTIIILIFVLNEYYIVWGCPNYHGYLGSGRIQYIGWTQGITLNLHRSLPPGTRESFLLSFWWLYWNLWLQINQWKYWKLTCKLPIGRGWEFWNFRKWVQPFHLRCGSMEFICYQASHLPLPLHSSCLFPGNVPHHRLVLPPLFELWWIIRQALKLIYDFE